MEKTRVVVPQQTVDAMVARARAAYSVDRKSNGEIIDGIAGAYYGEGGCAND